MTRLASAFLVALILACTACERQSASVLSQIEHHPGQHEAAAAAPGAEKH